MSDKNKARATSVKPRHLLAAIGFLLASCWFAWSIYADTQARQDVSLRVSLEAKQGHAKETDIAMRKYPGLWQKKEFSVTELMQLMKTDAISTVGLLDEFNSHSGMPELLVSTKTGALGYITDTSRGLLTEKLIAQQADHVHVTRVTVERSALSIIAGTIIKFVVNYLFLIVLVGMALSQVLPLLTLFQPTRNVKTRFKDVVGVAEAKAALQDIMDLMTAPDAYKQVGANPPRGVLLSGPPGTGKTLLAKALAGECGVPFISCSGADFTSSFYGMGILKVKRLFAVARRQKKCIIFIDEIDGIGKRTESARGPEAAEFNRIINQFLVEMDGFAADERIVVIGATNLVDNMDPAMLREGRFDRKIVLQLPDADDRANLFRVYGANLKLASDIDFDQLARMTFGLSPAAVAGLVNQAAVRAARARAEAVTMAHLADAIETAHLGEASGLVLTEEERYWTAIHESGHAMAVVARETGKLEKVTVLPRGRALGLTMASQAEHQHLFNEKALLGRIHMLLAGRAAEEVVFGQVSIGASDDLKKATELATAMLTQYGFGAGLAVLLPEQVQQSSTLAQVNDLLSTRYQLTIQFLRENRHTLEAIAQRLVADETIDGCVVRELMAAASPEA